jgi:hypothetical protein
VKIFVKLSGWVVSSVFILPKFSHFLDVKNMISAHAKDLRAMLQAQRYLVIGMGLRI